MHCHLIVSRKDQYNKKKLSPLTNHKNTKKGAIKGGFDRINLFKQTEQGFNKLFAYNRPLSESFEYYNTMKNGTIAEQLKMQEQQISDERKINECSQACIYADKQTNISENNFANKHENLNEHKQENRQSLNLPNTGISSVLGLLTPDAGSKEDEQIPMKKKVKKRPKQGFRR